MERLEGAAKLLTAEQVIVEEVRLIDASFRGGKIPQDGARGGRDLRVHADGDVGSTGGAEMIGGAASRWRRREGGSVVTYTHYWRAIPKAAWGDDISVLASVEVASDIEVARVLGYASAIVVEKFPNGDKAFSLPGSSARIIPCPEETRGLTCVECRLCLDRPLLKMNAAIAFQVHGQQAAKAIEALRMMNRAAEPEITATAAPVEPGSQSPAESKPDGTVKNPSRAPPPTSSGASVPASTARQLPFRTATEIAAAVGANVKWIARPWVAESAITLIDGKPKAAGKSTLVLHLIGAVLSGAEFLGKQTRKSSVVMLTEERPETYCRNLKRAGLLKAENLHVVFHQDVKSMAWPDVMTLATQKCQAVGARLLVIDTLAQFYGDSGSLSRKALDGFRPVQAAAELGVGVICVRHERKSGGEVGDSARGSSAITGAADIVLAVQRPPNHQGGVRVINALSRFEETPSATLIELGVDGYVALEDAEAITNASDSEEPEPDPKGTGGAPPPAAPYADAEVAEGPRPASVERESGGLATAGAGRRNNDVDSFGRRIALIGAHVQKQIAADAVEEYEVPPAVSGMPRPMTVLLAKRNANLIKCAWHGDKRTFCPPIWADFAIGSGACGFGCRLCFLMLTFRVRRDPLRPYVYTNIDDYDRAARKWLLAKCWTVKFGEKDVERPRTSKDSIGLGIDCADSLLWEGITGHARNLVPLFTDSSTNPLQNPLILLTKSANTHYLGQLSDRDLRRHDGKVPNIAVTMSLNPEGIADLWEGKYPDTMERITPPIERRLAALRDAQEMGFEVRVRVDPILTRVRWQEQYREFFNAMAHRIGLRPTMITLGSYREKNAQLDHWRAEWKLPAVEWEPEKTLGRDGTHVHDANREVAYFAVRDMISESYKGTGFMPNVSLCKETHEVRKATDLCNANCNCLRAPSTWKADGRSSTGAGVSSTDASAALPSAAGVRP